MGFINLGNVTYKDTLSVCSYEQSSLTYKYNELLILSVVYTIGLVNVDFSCAELKWSIFRW